MTPLFVLLLLLHVTRSNIVFGDKSNADLYCRISDSAVDQLSIEPAKHVYTDDNGDSYIYNGAAVTLTCSNSSLTFTNAVVAYVANTDEYKLYKSAVVECYYSTIVVPDILSGISTYCADGCYEPYFTTMANYEISPTVSDRSDSEAPYPAGTYTVSCSAGYVRAWKDDGDNYFKCYGGDFNATQADLVVCAPGCEDLAEDIIPYIRALAIKPSQSTERNQVWPGAPYPHGAKLAFTCYGGDKNELDNDDSDIYCYQDGEKGTAGTCASDTCWKSYGYWNSEVPVCEWKYAGSLPPS